MDATTSFEACFEPWTTSAGPARLMLLQPLRDDLRAPVDVLEESVAWAIEPLSWLIERAAVSGILSDEWGTTPEFTAFGNARFGWDPEPVDDEGGRGFSEIDALHLLARDLGAIERAGARDIVTWSGRIWLGDPARLWRTAARQLVVRGGFFSAQCELVLASLLQQDRLDEQTAGARLAGAMIEAAGGEDYLERIDQTGRPRGEAVTDFIGIGMHMVRTLGSGLRMFDEELHPEELRPWLGGVGRAMVIESLRASLITHRSMSGMGKHVEGAWN